ncbi:adenosylcobinamide-GDP ribazoletransferase [Nocardioides cavernaquae]|uniref:Adenosylcobinamide-GDP ribazoletransferase n=1 Tax=Nocardioides cavernaquae TaxID=2321396 RepID=A0A3A5HCI6_9ACTN|nr:adenosylcobinamide-GDP ribazoletransferase [Nocardioides cavernaquae]RJS48002.1 adenosylcobinamide-GDP ribazoletransferase [Nocardioides cavernaquae]
MRLLPDSLRLAFGTLTILPVKPPTRVDRDTAGWAMTFAPLVGLVLATLLGVPLWLLSHAGAGSPFLLAALTIGALAWLTRAMHLDGLADVADGLGSGRRGEDALAIMKKSDIGPFGVATLLLVLLIQVTALATCIGAGYGVLALVGALVVSRLALVELCRPSYPAARADGLGSVVAGSVPHPRAASVYFVTLSWLPLMALGLVRLGWANLPAGWTTSGTSYLTWLAVVLPALATGPLFARHAMRRFGGVTGDVYGATIEVAFTSVLVTLAFVA